MKDGSRISLLDCTLRDGGMAIDDHNRDEGGCRNFTATDRETIAFNLNRTGFEYVELGSIMLSGDDRLGQASYQTLEGLSEQQPTPKNPRTQFTGLYRFRETPSSSVPVQNGHYCECVRQIIVYSIQKDCIDFCADLCQKGYKVFIQPAVTARFTEDELFYLLDRANEMKPHAFYIVDSYGYMHNDDVQYYWDMFDKRLDKSIKIGFHSHNHLNLAFSNAIYFMNIPSDREIIVDSSLLGMGQGAGNLQTEVLSNYMNSIYGKQYNYNAVLDAAEIVDDFLTHQLWGYSLPYAIAAVTKTAYKFAWELRKRGFSYSDIYEILNVIPEEHRHRFIPDKNGEPGNIMELVRHWEVVK